VHCNALRIRNMSEQDIKKWDNYKAQLLDFTEIAEPGVPFPERGE
jgi:hypothetical protein